MNKAILVILFVALITSGCMQKSKEYKGLKDDVVKIRTESIISDSIIYHPVRIDQNGNILPWYSSNLGVSYDHILNLVWNFWDNMARDSNGEKYYMNHQVWRPEHDKRGLGGDQPMMALSSWDLLYNYTGNGAIVENMKYMADYYLAHSLSSPDSKWPDLPYPYNTDVESGIYDGDMMIGKGFLQPDKAGSLGFELVKLYKKTGNKNYLAAAVKIANTLASKVQPGDNNNSPWPFKVNAQTGEVGTLKQTIDKKTKITESAYTSNWTGTLSLFDELIGLKEGHIQEYQKAWSLAANWLKNYPAKTNKWGPFFEDIPIWSDTQINAITYATYLMEHPDFDPHWKETVKAIFLWVYKELGNQEFVRYGVTCVNEQTAYQVPGNSHTSRQASAELMYWEKTGDTTFVRNAVRELNWATYMVDMDGKNRYPRDDVWMTDGYGDYVRHYLRSMAATPQLAPENADHLLKSSSIVKNISYQTDKIAYTIFDDSSVDLFRLTTKPQKIEVNGKVLKEVPNFSSEGWVWQILDKGGVLTVTQKKGTQIEIIKGSGSKTDMK